MNLRYLGDSYDIVKQSLLRWLADIGTWTTHPMFTEPVSTEQADTFPRLLGTRLLSSDTLAHGTDRDAYLAPARDCNDHVFLDPDTGISLEPTRGVKAPHYLVGTELVPIADARPERLILVFDQSLAGSQDRDQLRNKLNSFANQGVLGIAYVSHACFVLMGKNRRVLESAFGTLNKESRIPESRFLSWNPQSRALQRIADTAGSR
jgi:hypothetical protein